MGVASLKSLQEALGGRNLVKAPYDVAAVKIVEADRRMPKPA